MRSQPTASRGGRLTSERMSIQALCCCLFFPVAGNTLSGAYLDLLLFPISNTAIKCMHYSGTCDIPVSSPGKWCRHEQPWTATFAMESRLWVWSGVLRPQERLRPRGVCQQFLGGSGSTRHGSLKKTLVGFSRGRRLCLPVPNII